MALTPQDLRDLADRLEQEATTQAEQREAERLQAAVDAGHDALAEKLVERLSERIDARIEETLNRRRAADDEEDGDEEEGGAHLEAGSGDAGEEEETDGHDGDILPGRWRSQRIFGAKLYSGSPEPDTVRFRNEKGQLQSRPGRVPGKPYQHEWVQVEEPDSEEPADEDAA